MIPRLCKNLRMVLSVFTESVHVYHSLARFPHGGSLCELRNAPPVFSKALDRWAYENGVTLDFSRPGKPTGNASWRASTAGSVTSHNPTGSCRWRMPGPRSRLAAGLSLHIAWLADAGRICCCRGQDRGRMNAGNSPSTWMRNRGTLMSAGKSPSAWMRKQGTLFLTRPLPAGALQRVQRYGSPYFTANPKLFRPCTFGPGL